MPTTANRSYRYPAKSAPPGVGWRDIQQLAEDVDADMARQVAMSANEAGINNVLGSGTQLTTSYANMAATSSFSFTKLVTGTRLCIDMHVTAYITVAIQTMEFAVAIAGTDYQIGKLSFNNLSVHTQMSGTRYLAAGIAAGTLTVQARWKLSSASGSPQLNTDSGDWISLRCREVW